MRAMSTAPVKTRFAPSPTGRLHLGNLRTALFNALYARAGQGVFLLRSEDTDLERSRETFLEGIMEDLRWLGLDWQEGPGSGGAEGPYRQSERADIYAGYYQALVDADRAYPCFCSETELRLERKLALQAHRAPRYSGRCARLEPAERGAHLAAGRPHTLRFRVEGGRRIEFEDLVRGPQAMASDEIGDFVIRRTDGTPAFFFSNAVDDALMGVTHVLRGEDHLTNTPRQLLLLEALGLPAPRYGHISMIVGDDGGPLSKRTGSASLDDLRAAGYLPIAILNHLARLGHHSGTETLLDLDDLAADFRLDQLGRAPARHDMQQLRHWQKLAVSALDAAGVEAWLRGWEGAAELESLVPGGRLAEFAAAAGDNLFLPADGLRMAREWFGDPDRVAAEVRSEIASAGSDFFEAAGAAFVDSGQPFGEFARAVRERTGLSGKRLFMPLRAAMTYAVHGPEMGRILPLLDADRVRRRLKLAAEWAAREDPR